MREIKFRGWDKVSNTMIYTPNLMLESAIKDKNAIVMQFIGLKDKNGKEIYEGDIVSLNCTSHKGVTATIKWGEHHPKCSGDSVEGSGEYPHEESYSICNKCLKKLNDELCVGGVA